MLTMKTLNFRVEQVGHALPADGGQGALRYFQKGDFYLKFQGLNYVSISSDFVRFADQQKPLPFVDAGLYSAFAADDDIGICTVSQAFDWGADCGESGKPGRRYMLIFKICN